MRRVAAAALAIPVLAVIYMPLLGRRSVALRAGSVAVVALLAITVALSTFQPQPAAARPPRDIVPVAAAAFQTHLRTGVAPDEAITLQFSVPMDPVSVASSLRVEPAAPVDLAWDDARRALTVSPRTTWATGTHHTITVDAGALAVTGQPLPAPARAAFVTRRPVVATVSATEPAGMAIRPTSAIEILFSDRIDATTVGEAFTVEPAITGRLQRVGSTPNAARYLFTPDEPLEPGTAYRFRLKPGILDRDGAPVASPGEITFTTAAAPKVVRFRPVASAEDVERAATLSVRFTAPMERRSLAKALSVKADGTTVEGEVRFAEDDTVLVFDPAEELPYGATVTVTIDRAAASTAGVAMGRDAQAAFVVEPEPEPEPVVESAPAPAPASTPRSTPKPSSPPSSGGGSVGGGTWASVETFYLGLMNCTRTGGWVTSTGSCSSPGGRDVAALKLDSGISSKVARPYAKILAERGECTHFIGGNPGDRLRRAGYDGYVWAENLGCRSGDAKQAVLGSHLYFQSEKPYNGGHYRHIMDAKYDRVGIGVWVSGGRVRLVVDFYHPR